MLTQKLPFLLPSRDSPVAWPLKRKGYLLPFLSLSFSACDPRGGEIRKKTAFASPGPYMHSTEVGKKSSSKKVKESVCVTREVRCNREEKEKWVFLLAAIPAVLRKFEPKPSSPFSAEIQNKIRFEEFTMQTLNFTAQMSYWMDVHDLRKEILHLPIYKFPYSSYNIFFMRA